ncbi:zinc ribbon domain-containing protein [Nonomuraea angiospora]|uniref:Nucleic acid-binding Zn-ribbon protein n=1 Tax=Nonomuraea angiospora TaxID=46172 RepID=A0ABR9M027_9ACTN|nr:C4-type zinc ribbon domain-containing protein [Nonomuraea angiospora]MBE1585945.1 putative nucleic acid-binding Zn-ribbon protein [Nonomuraea angiospora]MDX3108767.1 C4-type zinc ribbon domain-containing protein [Nonomuraea angiospora]
MKAAPEAQKRLLDLAELDSVIDRLAHRRRTLPELAEIDERSKLFAKVATQVIEAETEAGDLAREQAKAESDVDAVRTRADRDQKRLDSGAVTSPRDLSSLQSEIASLHKRQGDLEEVVLEIMERREAADTKVTDLITQRDELAAALSTAEARRDEGLQEIDKEASEVQGRRGGVAGEIPADLLALYEKLKGQYGVGAAMLRGGRCQGCKVALSIAEMNRIKAAPHDEVLRCEECRRILVRTAESGL